MAEPPLATLQRTLAAAIMQPLGADWQMRATPATRRAAALLTPGRALAPDERLEIYNRQYWFRLLDCLYDDYPGLRALWGERRFLRLARAYLQATPSRSWALRDLGQRLERYLRTLRTDPAWAGDRLEAAIEMARFEWAQIVAFDALALPPLAVADLANTPPGELRLRLQPHLTLLELRYAVDDLAGAAKDALRADASQAAAEAPTPKANTRARTPRRHARRVGLAVHRVENAVYLKPLEPGAVRLLRALGRGATVEEACVRVVSTGRKTHDWAATLQEWFETWAQLGWLARAED